MSVQKEFDVEPSVASPSGGKLIAVVGTPADGDVPTWVAANSRYEPQAGGGGGGGGTGSTLSYTTNLSLYYKASNASVTGPRVTSLDDDASSSGGVTLTQASAELQPMYLPNRINGQPTMLFSDGQYLAAASTPMSGTNNYTVFAVIVPILGDGSHRIAWMNGTGSVGYGLSVTTEYEALIQLVTFGATGSRVFRGVPQIVCVQRASGTSTVYRNGLAGPSTTASTPATPTQFLIGANGSNANFVGEIAEVIGFNESMSGGNRDTVTADLATAYDITIE
jgi:hypothetical protein